MPPEPDAPGALNGPFWARKGFVLPLCVLLLGLLATVEVLTPEELSFSIFYFVPVVLSSWSGGRRWGFLFAFLAAMAYLAANFASSAHFDHIHLRLVTTFNELAGNLFLAYLTDQLRRSLTAQESLRLRQEAQQRRLKVIYDHLSSGLFVLDTEGRLLSFNRAFAMLLGLSANATVQSVAQDLETLLDADPGSIQALIQACQGGPDRAGQDFGIPRTAHQPSRWLHVSLTAYQPGEFLGLVTDVTQRKEAEVRSRELAVQDHLTGICNRRGFEARLEWLQGECERNPARPFTILFVDLDRFKEVNDSFGHEAGDQVLQAVAAALQAAVRKSDLAARMGGDEFVVLLDFTNNRDDVAAVAGKILALLQQPIDLGGGRQAAIGASIGVGRWKAGMERGHVEEVLREADAAMYQAKQAGRNRIVFGGEDR